MFITHALELFMNNFQKFLILTNDDATDEFSSRRNSLRRLHKLRVSSKTFQAASFLSCALIPADLIILLHLVVFLSSLMSINYEFII